MTDLNAARLHQPVVSITHDPNGSQYPTPLVVDLANQGGSHPERAIESVVGENQTSSESTLVA